MNTQAVKEYEQDTHWILQLLENIFRPIVRLLYQNGVGYPMVHATIKRLYVDVAHEDAAARSPFKDPTISSMALNTGMDPKEVKSELESLENDNGNQDSSWLPNASPEVSVLEWWTEKAPFVNEAGKPLDLPVFGSGVTFERLIKRVCGNIGPAEIRDRLYEAGCIEIVRGENSRNQRKLRLVKRYYTAANRMDLLAEATMTLRHVVLTLSRNLDPSIEKENRFTQQERWTKRLRPQDVKEFRARILGWVREKVIESEGVMGPFEKDPFDTDEHVHAGCGFYYFEEAPRLRDQFQYAS